MAVSSPSESWIGASMLRKEDARHLLGHGMFIADVRVPGVQDVAFVRSDVAHAEVRRVLRPPGTAGHVFTLADIGPLNILEAGPELCQRTAIALFRRWPTTGVRYVGQPDRRLHAADPRPGRRPRSTRSSLNSRLLPAVVDCVEAMKPVSPLPVRLLCPTMPSSPAP